MSEPGTENDYVEGGVDIRNNRESQAGARDAASSVARASDGGAPPKDAPAAGDQPDVDPAGTAGGDPLSGVSISDDDRADAVSADSGPDELGDRGPQPG